MDCSPGYVCASADTHMCLLHQLQNVASEAGWETDTQRLVRHLPALLLVGLSPGDPRTEPLPLRLHVERGRMLPWGPARLKWPTGRLVLHLRALEARRFLGIPSAPDALAEVGLTARRPRDSPPASPASRLPETLSRAAPQATCSFVSHAFTQSGYRRDTYVHTCMSEEMDRFGWLAQGWA